MKKLLILAFVLCGSPVYAQTYFPFGSVAIGTTSTSIRVGQFGCAVSAADPTYTVTQIHPCSLTTEGRIRVDVLGSILVEPGTAPIEVNAAQSGTWTVSISNGSVAVTEDGDITASTANVAQTASVLYGTNGTTRIVYFVDPCESVDKTTDPISITADTIIIPATSGKKNYICSIDIVASAAEIVSITEGADAVCATGEAAIVGSTTDANGMSFGANGGFAKGNGKGTVYAGKTANVNTCLNVSGSNRVSGSVTWVQR